MHLRAQTNLLVRSLIHYNTAADNNELTSQQDSPLGSQIPTPRASTEATGIPIRFYLRQAISTSPLA